MWRRLKVLGALYLRDGVDALPADAMTRGQLEWLQLRVREADGETTLREELPNTVAEVAIRAARQALGEGAGPSATGQTG